MAFISLCMSLEITIVALIFMVGLIVIARKNMKKPHEIGQAWRVPWGPILYIGIIVTIILVGHLIAVL